jgi:hypothetical protein
VIERVGATPDSHEAAAEDARQSPAAPAETSRNWQIKTTGALIF